METLLSRIDGERGELVVRGFSLEDLAGWRPEEVAGLLWGRAPEGLGEARVAAWERLKPVLPVARGLGLMDGLRMCSAVAPEDPVGAWATVAVAAGSLMGPGVAPEPDLGVAADLLRMVRGARASAAEERALEVYLVTVAEHGLNASTYAGRVIASTRAGLGAALAGALGALKGPLHGGAPGPVLDMLDAVGSVERAPAWVAARLAAGERLMGFGHRVYRVRDPRADVLKAAVAGLAPTPRLRLAEAVEAAALEALSRAKPGRRLSTNVEFYTALLLEALGFPRDGFTCVFAVGRTPGWIAHVLEQERDGRLIRPA